MANAFLGEAHGAAQPLGQRGELVPGVLRELQPRRVRGERGLQLVLALAGDVELLLDLGAATPGLLLGRLLALGLLGQGHVVVGGQAEPRVAQLGLHGLGAAGDLGLPAQRLEPAAQLGGEVGEPGEVGLHRVELAERLLLALAVLEDPGRLLDVGAAVLRLDCSTPSSWPCPTMTCISRPMPESLSSSCTSSSRAREPLISYSPAPSRNIRRVTETSE